MDKFTYLGRKTEPPRSPDEAVLDRIDNPHPDTVCLVRLTAPEFTCLCPITGQPDFAHLVIDYAPGQFLVESKSFKLFVFSFRDHSCFHEDCVPRIGKRLCEALDPHWVRVCGFWNPRGGIPIDVFWTHGHCPAGAYVPDIGVSPYRGRG